MNILPTQPQPNSLPEPVERQSGLGDAAHSAPNVARPAAGSLSPRYVKFPPDDLSDLHMVEDSHQWAERTNYQERESRAHSCVFLWLCVIGLVVTIAAALIYGHFFK